MAELETKKSKKLTSGNQIFDYLDYKSYLRDRIESTQNNRGMKYRISEHILCQPSYLSQVLSDRAELTLEHSSRLNSFFHHTKLESRYFILLVELARAGTEDLKNHFLSEINEVRETRHNLKKRFADSETVPESAQHKYYSTWFYAAIHVALSIPENQSVERIAHLYNLPVPLVSEAIEFLECIGLVENHNGQFCVTKRNIHLGRESAFIQRHHINWRSQALQSVEKGLPGDLHYSNVVAMSESDFKEVREVLICAIENARKIIAPSKEEKVYAITLDLFKL